MENEELKPLPRHKLTLHKDDVCPLCKDKFINEEKKLSKDVMNAQGIGAIHTACIMPYCPEDEIKILFKIRCYSIGDAISTTPVLREVRRIYPLAKITVMTFYPELFEYNPRINLILDLNKKIMQDQVDAHHFQIDGFDSARGMHFAMHSVEFSARSALDRSLYPKDWAYEAFCHPQDNKDACEIARLNGIDLENDKIIVVHPHGTEWKTRDWGPHRMPELCKELREKYPDHKLVSIGGKRNAIGHEMKNYVPIDGAIDLYGKMSLLQTLAFLHNSSIRVLITPDTGTLHLSACVQELPIVGIFTLVRSVFRTPFRAGKFGYKFIGVESESGCNCTYESRQLTDEAYFGTCPKRTMLDKTIQSNLPKQFKLNGMRNSFPWYDWKLEDLNRQMVEVRDGFREDALPCFPSVDRVLGAVDDALQRWPRG